MIRAAIRSILPRIGWTLGLTAVLTILIVACGEPSSSTPAQTATAAATITIETPQPVATLVPTSAEPRRTPQLTGTPTQGPEVRQPSPTPTITPISDTDEQRDLGQIEGITFVVGEGSEATFTVEEKLARLPLPSDAVGYAQWLSRVRCTWTDVLR